MSELGRKDMQAAEATAETQETPMAAAQQPAAPAVSAQHQTAAAPARQPTAATAASVQEAPEPVRLTLPLDRGQLRELCAGQEVRLSGPIYTMRDAGHARALEVLEQTGRLPFGLKGQTLFYAGPTPAAAGRPLGSVGPTTSSRMDFATPALMDAGIAACLGKGKRSASVAEACVRNGAVYFACVGGIAALLATHVTASELVAWEDLGTEALRRLELEDFPAFVAIDTQGRDLYRAVESGETI